MSFTAHRVYTLAAGKNFNPLTNGNVAVKFRGLYEASVANEIKVISFNDGINPIDQWNSITGAGGTPVIFGPGYVTPVRQPINALVGPQSFQTVSQDPASNGLPDGIYDYYIFDSSTPSTLDSPILAFHVAAQANPPQPIVDDFDFVTLTNNLVNIIGGGLVTGGVYPYSIAQVSLLSPNTEILGLAPASRSNQW